MKNMIQIKNVLLGDCSILETDRSLLVVDCGSKNSRTTVLNPYKADKEMFAYSKILHLENDNHTKKDLLISHYHEDHFNGILKVECPYNCSKEHWGDVAICLS